MKKLEESNDSKDIERAQYYKKSIEESENAINQLRERSFGYQDSLNLIYAEFPELKE